MRCRDGQYKDGKFLVTEQISPRRSKTPEGYLLCEEVVISRTGTFDYTPAESGIDVPNGDVAHITRDESELFRPETIASFEGKPVVVGHDKFADPTNWREIAVGTVQNVRRGEGEKASLLLADLLLTDARGIRLVESGELEEVSCGYDASTVDDGGGRGHQVGIVGNHVALVQRARCGSVCKIGDGTLMKKSESLKAKIRRWFKDGDEAALNEQLDELPNDLGAEKKDEEPSVAPEEDRIANLEAMVAELAKKVEAITTPQADEDENELADEDEIVGDEEAEKAVADADELCPGGERPQGDAANGKFTRSAIERIKRLAIKGAGITAFGDAAMLKGEALDIAFKGALAMKRQGRNPSAKPVGDVLAQARKSNSELNAVFRDFWSKK